MPTLGSLIIEIATDTGRLSVGLAGARRELAVFAADAERQQRSIQALQKTGLDRVAAGLTFASSGAAKWQAGLRQIELAQGGVTDSAGRMTAANLGSVTGFRKVESAVANLGIGMLGVRGTAGKLSEGLLMMGVGGGVTLAITAGLAVIGFAYEKLTEQTRKAREEQQKFVEEGAKAARLRFDPAADAREKLRGAQAEASALSRQIDEAVAHRRAAIQQAEQGLGRVDPALQLQRAMSGDKQIAQWSVDLDKATRAAAEFRKQIEEIEKTASRTTLHDLSFRVGTFGMDELEVERARIAMTPEVVKGEHAKAFALLDRLAALTRAKKAEEEARDRAKQEVGDLVSLAQAHRATLGDYERLIELRNRDVDALRKGGLALAERVRLERDTGTIEAALGSDLTTILQLRQRDELLLRDGNLTRKERIRLEKELVALNGILAAARPTESRLAPQDRTRIGLSVEDEAALRNAAASRALSSAMTGVGGERGASPYRQWLAQTRNAAQEWREAWKVAIEAGAQTMANFFQRALEGGMKLKDFLIGLLSSIAAPFWALIGTQIAGSLGKAVGLPLPATAATVQHAGGMAGSGPPRLVDSWLFAAAARAHGGLKVGEIPIIAQTGERVLSRQETADYDRRRGQAPAGGGGSVVIQQHITFAPRFIDGPSGAAWLRSQAGTLAGIVAEAAVSAPQFARVIVASGLRG